ncbi:MBL fold metallo-hydrolase [Micromonospora sp. 15K316]|uniref:MBL fold metallo-hydrolase n=1 Tax=Micromonospora sp. 15K316 TaxID=2530376 RepID=UPI00104C215A|nr:MBL fold metallo-hydrolase [Micromonospora sp. 15K316]TDC39798.1 MBL fold metallo-hydrolase [Micromonospora sp. 15K316]
MRVAKYLHSCLLVDTGAARLLIDPGRFTFVEGHVTPEDFGDLDAIAVTHHHPDHADPDALTEIMRRTGAPLLGNRQSAEHLAAHGLTVTVLEPGEHHIAGMTIGAIRADHEPVLADETPANTAYLVDGRVLHCGDSLHPALFAHRGVDLLAVPVMGPYLTERLVAGFIAQLRPVAVVPLHDGYAKDFFIAQRYDTYRPYVEQLGITWHNLTGPGDTAAL